MGVDRLVLETRQERKDRLDIEMYLALKASGAASAIDMEHRGANGEPRLWLPDSIVGVYGDEPCGNLARSRRRSARQLVRSRISAAERRL